MRFDGLGHAVWCDFCVGPGHGPVAVFDGPVALFFVRNCLILRWGKLRSKLEFRSMSRRHCGILHHDGPEDEERLDLGFLECKSIIWKGFVGFRLTI